MQLYVCLYDRVALLKGTNQNLSMRSLQIQWYQEIWKKNLGTKQELLDHSKNIKSGLRIT